MQSCKNEMCSRGIKGYSELVTCASTDSFFFFFFVDDMSQLNSITTAQWVFWESLFIQDTLF